MTLTPNLSAFNMASSICLLIPSAANGRKYCQTRPMKINALPFKQFFLNDGSQYSTIGHIKPTNRCSEYLKAKPGHYPCLVQSTPQVVEGDRECLGPCPHSQHNPEGNGQAGDLEKPHWEWLWCKRPPHEWCMHWRCQVHDVCQEHKISHSLMAVCDKVQSAWVMDERNASLSVADWESTGIYKHDFLYAKFNSYIHIKVEFI